MSANAFSCGIVEGTIDIHKLENLSVCRYQVSSEMDLLNFAMFGSVHSHILVILWVLWPG